MSDRRGHGPVERGAAVRVCSWAWRASSDPAVASGLRKGRRWDRGLEVDVEVLEQESEMRLRSALARAGEEATETNALGQLDPTSSDANHDRLGTKDSTVAQLRRLPDPVLASLRVGPEIRHHGHNLDFDLRTLAQRQD